MKALIHIYSLFSVPATSRGSSHPANVCHSIPPYLSTSSALASLFCLPRIAESFHHELFASQMLSDQLMFFKCLTAFYARFVRSFVLYSFQAGEHVCSLHKISNADVSALRIAQSGKDDSQMPIVSDCSIPNLVIPKAEPQKVGFKVVEGDKGPAFTEAKSASAPQVLPQQSIATEDDSAAEEEKWRTDRFFLGTDTYIAINPRALTEKCASGLGCPFHPFCDFAHELSELRERPLTQMWNFKTKLCDKFHSSAACCPYGNRW